MRKDKFVLQAGAFALTALTLAVNLPAAIAVDQNMTVTLVTHANKAAKAYNGQQWSEAKNEFRICIAERPQSIEFYDGLFNTCIKSGEWDQVALALEKIFGLDPSQKMALSYEYGQALFHLGRYDDAIPYLKAALRTVGIEAPIYIPKIYEMPTTKPNPDAPQPPPPPPPVDRSYKPTKAEMEKALSFLNAVKSECIVLAEFDGLEKGTGIIGWNNPPEARYHVTEILKGPPLTHSLPVKYEFHNLIQQQEMPPGWKFDAKQLPAKGSKWILFIEYAVPKQGRFELYQGSYGRQETNDENLNKLYGLLDQYNMRNTHS